MIWFCRCVGKLITVLRKFELKVKYLSRVNLVANRGVGKELIADRMTVEETRNQLESLLYNKKKIQAMIDGYDEVRECLGEAGAPQNAARQMIALLKKK